MNLKLRARARDIYLECVKCENREQRSALVRARCRGDAELEQDVQRLLAANDAEGSFLEGPPVPFRNPVANDPGETSASAPGSAASPSGSCRTGMDKAPRHVGPYKIVARLGEGGMGEVFVAEQREPVERTVAIKLIKRGMDSNEVIARFEAERQALALMDHPNISRVLEAGQTDDGRPYFVMDFVRGVPINEYCDKHQLSLDDRLELFVQVCHAVQHAHQKGIIHRDLKPSNVLVELHDVRHVAKVIDFGLAKATNRRLTERTLFTQASHMVGTPLYMSPEQAELSGLDVDTRSDIYSLGVVLYELITGTTPCDRDMMRKVGFDEMRRIIREDDPPRPSDRISTINAKNETTVSLHRPVDTPRLHWKLKHELDWIVMKSLEKDRSRRYETAVAFADDIERFLRQEPVEACPPTKSYRLRKFAGRHRGAIITSFLIAATMLIATGVSLWYASQAGLAADAAGAAKRDAEDKATLATRMAAEASEASEEAKFARERESLQRILAERALYSSDTKLAAEHVARGTHSEAMRYLFRQYPMDAQRDYRSWEWFYLLDRSEQSVLNWDAHPWIIREIAWSPDGQQIATASHGGLSVWDAESAEKQSEYHLGRTLLCCVDWSHDGAFLAWGSAADESIIYVRDQATGKIEQLTSGTSSVWELDWSDDGQSILVGTIHDANMDPRNLVLWRRGEEGWKIEARIEIPDHVQACAWSPDHQKIAVAYGQSYSIFSPDTLETIHDGKLSQVIHDGEPGTSIAWAPSGKVLAFGSNNGLVSILDAESYELTTQFDGHVGPLQCLQFSPDGNYLASAGLDGAVKLWNSETWELHEDFYGHSGIVTDVAWHPDSKLVTSAGHDGVVNIWPIIESDDVISHEARNTFTWTRDNLIRDIVDGNSLVDRDPTSGRVVRTTELPERSSPWILQDLRLATRLLDEEDLHGLEVLLLDSLPSSETFELEGEVKHAYLVQLSPSKKTLAYQLRHFYAPASLRTLADDTVRGLGDESYVDTHVIRWSPSGQQVVVAGGGISSDHSTPARAGWLFLLDGETGETLSRLPVGRDRFLATVAEWSPDGSRIAAASGDGICDIYDPSNRRRLFSRKLHLAVVRSMTWHPDGTRVATASDDRTIKIWDSRSGDVLISLPTGTAMSQIAWSPDGTLLAAREPAKGRIRVWNAREGYRLDQSNRFQGRLTKQWLDELILALEAEDLARATQVAGALSGRSNLDARTFYYIALVQAATGDGDALRQTVMKSFELADQELDALSAFFLSWMTVLTPDAIDSYEIPTRLARSAVKARPDAPQFLRGLGAVLFRSGNHEASRQALVQSLKQDPESRSSKAYVEYFLAMAEHELGDVDSARQHLNEANRVADDEIAGSPSPNRRMTLGLLRKEAEALIGSNQDSGK